MFNNPVQICQYQVHILTAMTKNCRLLVRDVM